jgi:hypothetical protein
VANKWYFDSEKADKHRDLCSWKPICEKCRGTGKYNTHPDNILEDIPCPTCQKPQEETLLVPAKWESVGIIYSSECEVGYYEWWLASGRNVLGKVRKLSKDMWKACDTQGYICSHDTFEHAKATVEKTLGVRKG